MTTTTPAALRRRDRAAREADEDARLSPAATRAAATRGRRRPEDPDPDRTPFEVDRDRILHSKAFRRLKHKTQVFLLPSGDHVVTRLTHTLQVTQVARALAAGLGLNEPLVEAIALAHDVGHPPFGHTGEDALDPLLPGGWHHAAQSVRIFEVLEDRNLTEEVRDGVRAHSWKIVPPPATPEGACVRFADRIAYLTHDALDALDAGVLRRGDVPADVEAVLGPVGGGWIGAMVGAVLDESADRSEVAMRSDVLEAMHALRAFLFERVYRSARTAADQAAASQVVRDLVEHCLAHPQTVPATYRDAAADPLTQTVDFVAGMTDRYAVARHRALFGPSLTRTLPAAG